MAKDDNVQAMVGLIKSLIKKERGAFSPYVQATYVSADLVDPNLSVINVNGTQVRKVRKAKHVGTIAAGEQVVCIRGNGMPMTIIMVTVGDITKTEG